MKTTLRLLLSFSVVLLLSFFQKADATVRTFQFSGTTIFNSPGSIAGDAMVATLVYDDASTPIFNGSDYATYNFISYIITVGGNTYTASSGTIEVVNNSGGSSQFVVSANGGILQLSLQNGTSAVFSSTALPISLTLSEFTPNGNYFGVVSGSDYLYYALVASITQIVPPSTTTTISSNNNPSFTSGTNSSVTFTATVSSTNTVNEGTVSFTSNGAIISGGSAVAVSNGTASLTTSISTEGANNIVATYNGTANFATSNGSLTQMVNNHTTVSGNTFCNSASSITASSSTTGIAASPYPSEIFVSGLSGTINSLTVSINGFQSTKPSSVELLLVGPGNKTFILLTGYGGAGSNPYNIGNLVFSDAGTAIPGTLTSGGTYRPTAVDPGSLAAPAPAGPYNLPAPGGSATLASVFTGINPNGTWQLYEYDTYVGTSPTLISGWCLNFTINPPIISAVTPNLAVQGTANISVVISGQNTNFVQGTSTANFGAGITINSLTVTDAHTATANITIDPAAPTGFHSVTVTTGSEVATQATAFDVAPGAPVISLVNPNSGAPGTTILSVAITGHNTHFVQGTTTASFGAGVTVNSVTVTDATDATVNISIDPGATLGAQNVTLTTGAEIVTLTGGFTISCISNPVVTSNSDAGPGSLRQAVIDACPGSTITFDMTQVVSPISLSGGQIIIDKNLTIQGPGANTLTIQNTAAASSTSRIFYVNAGVTAAISGVTITGGNTTGIGFVASAGGGIYNNGTLTLLNAILKNNSSSYGGGAILNYGGTLTVNTCTITGSINAIRTYASASSVPTTIINNSTITGNSDHAIQNDYGILTMTNCTISGNTASSGAAGIYNGQFGGTTNLYSCTITGNTSDIGAGIYNVGGSFYIKNSIVAGNIQTITSVFEPDITGTVISQGYNLIGNIGATPFTPATGDLVGTTASPINPLFDPNGLQDNGNTGGVQTIALLPGSAAIDAGGSCPATDQRGLPIVGACDIGSFGSQGFTMSIAGGNNQSAIVSTAFANPLTVNVSSSHDEPVSGGKVTFTVPVQTNPSCTITGGNVVTITGATAATGIITANALSGGPYNVTAGASGASSPVSFGLTNGNPATTAALSSSANPSVFGQSVTFTATVSPVSGSGTPTGTVTFMDGATTLGTASLGGTGMATWTTTSLGVGPHSITATYNGDGYFTGSGSPTFSQSVNGDATNTALISSTNPSIFGQSVTFTTTVSALSPGSGIPTGTVNFMDGASTLGVVMLDGTGSATWTTTSLGVGPHSISVTYSGDANFNSSGSISLSQVISTPTITTSTSSLTAFSACSGSASAIQTFIVGGANLAGNLVVTAPTGFEVSLDGTNFSSSVSLTQVSGTVATTTVYVHMASSASGTPTGNVACTSAQASEQDVVAVGTVNPLPTATIIVSGTPVCMNGASPTITFAGSGSTAPYTYSYSINNVAQTPITDNGSGSITLQVPTSAYGTFVYTLTSVQDASNTQCSQAIAGQSATVTINPLPSATISGATSVCQGAASPNVTFAGSGGTAPYTFTYSLFNGTTTTTTTATGNPATVPVSTATAGIYTYALISVQDANNCPQAVSSQSVQVTVNALPSANISTASMVTAVSTGNVASVDNAGTGATYLWTVTNGTITTGLGTNSITYTAGATGTVSISVSVTGPTGCGPVSSGILSIPITALPCPNPAITSPWVVCSASTGNTASVAKVSGSKYVWAISNGTITAGAGTNSIAYTAGASGIVTLSVTVTNASGQCTVSSGKYYVLISPLPSAAITANTSVCASSKGNIAYVPGCGTGSTYAWSITNGTITAGTGTSKITYTAGSSGSVTLSVTVTNAAGCKASSGSKSISISAYPVASIMAASSVCASSSGNAASVAGAGTGAKYAWSITNGCITAGAGTSSITYTATKSGSVTLSVTVTNSSGCSSTSASKVIPIIALPSATITTASSVCAGSTGNTASVPAVSGGTYVWTLSSGSTITSGSGTNSIKYTAPTSGTSLTISVTVTNSSGCKASSGTLKVTVKASMIPTFNSVPTLCVGAKAPSLPTESNNEITGTWNPSTISTKTTGTTTYTFTPATGQCASAVSVRVTVQSCQQAAVVTGEAVMPQTSDENQGRSIKVFPNPSVVGFTLELRSDQTEKVEIMVYDVVGHALHHATGDATGTYRFGETFIKGMYFVKVLYKDGSKVLKVVKQ